MTRVKDYSDDDSTRSLPIVTDITECNCLVSRREFTFIEDDDDTLEVQHGVEITLEMLCDPEDQVYRSLEELQEQE